MLTLLLITALLFCSIESLPSKWQHQHLNNKCGYESCHPVKEGFTNFHIIAHTHDDVGWLKTVDQYYYGDNKGTQNAGVQYILGTVMDSLSKNADRKFIYVETAFFWKWWLEQNDNIRNKVIDFVNNGQLEFIGGGWSMNDEGATHYHSIIDQMAWGLRKLNDTFGECGRPKIGWQIDTFGHSKEMANIFAQLGFDGFFFGRMDFQDQAKRFSTKTPELVWRGSKSLGETSDIFTGVLYNIYSAVRGFNFDEQSGDIPFIDNPESFEYNVDSRVDEFLSKIKNMTDVYATNNILVTMGDDFNYQNAESWFINLDKLIYYVNKRQDSGSKYNLLYSTPSCYVKAIYDETKNKTDWQLKTDDFLPHASDPHAYWTGYFSARPALKRYERLGNNFLQVCKQLFATAQLDPALDSKVDYLREAMGVLQHHDAISGTEKQGVADDYARHLERGIDYCETIAGQAISKQAAKTQSNEKLKTDPLNWGTCPFTNVSECSYSENLNSLVVTVYNPLSRSINKVLKLPVNGDGYVVSDENGNDVRTQVIPTASFVQNIPGRNSSTDNDLYFIVSDIPPLGWKSYIVTKSATRKAEASRKIIPNKNRHTIKKSGASFSIDSDTGLVSEITLNGVSLSLTQNFFYYHSFVGDNSNNDQRSSGAYIFRNNGSQLGIADKATYEIYEGEIIAEVQQKFNDFVSQTVRVNTVDNYVEFDWVIGPLPLDDPNGVEVVTKYSTDLSTNKTFYTDSNGKEMLQRIKDYRPTWDLDSQEPISSNYYPFITKITLKDEEQQLELAILNDRSQGGTSLNDGELEIMIHRFCITDDSFGEPLREEAFGTGLVIRGSHYVTLGSVDDKQDPPIVAIEKDVAQRKLLDTWVFFSTLDGSADDYRSIYNTQYAGLKSSLPDNVQILTLEQWRDTTLLLRLEHVFEKDEDSKLSEPVTVDLNDLFASFEIDTITETTLGGNQWLADSNRLVFKTRSTSSDIPLKKYLKDELDDLKVTLNPSDIRTFIVELKN